MIDINLLHDSQRVGFFSRAMVARRIVSERKKAERARRRVAMAALGLWIAALGMLAIPNLPRVMYRLFPQTTEAFAESLGEQARVEKSQFGEVVYEPPVYVPEKDESLPKENRIRIEAIGLDAVVNEASREEVESALRVGVWRTPEGGTPEDRQFPIILAAHRFGYLKWTNAYRRANSFYNLPKLENGDRVEVVWGQRVYEYEVFEGYTDTEIRDLDADLILYTCEVLNSDRRIIRKARLVVPEGYSNEILSGFKSVVAYSTE